MSELWREVRHAVRAMRAAPAFFGVAVLTIALGLGAVSAVFTVVNTILLRPLPYDRPESIAMIWSRWTHFDKTWVSIAEVFDYREQARAFEEIALWQPTNVNLTGNGAAAERVPGGQVTANTFRVLGVEPVVGRTFTAEEDAPNRQDTVLLGHELWRRRFGGDASIVDRTILVDGRARRVVGVMPAGFRLPLDFQEGQATELWLPIGIQFTNDPEQRGSHSYYAVGRLASGHTPEDATAELDTITSRLTEEGLYPREMAFSAFAVGVEDEIFGRVRPALLLLLTTVGFLLVITCANVMNLQLTRGEARRRDVAIRTALGASRLALLRGRLVESALIAGCGGAVGLALALLASRVLAGFDTAGVPRLAEAGIDLRVVGVTLAVAALAAVGIGVASASFDGTAGLTEALKEGSHGSAGLVRRRLRQALVIAQVTVALVLVVCAGLALRTLWAMQRIDTGFDPDHVLTAQLSLPQAGYAEPERVVAFYERALEQVRRLPGVESAGLVRSLPLAADIGDWGVQVEGYTPPPGEHAKGDWQVASDGYFEALGERLVAGRWFDARDTIEGPEVAVVNETMAALYWPDQSPINRRFRMGGGDGGPWVTVVGVVGDVRHNGITGIVKEKFYRPHTQFHRSSGFAVRGMTLVIRSRVEPASLVAAVRRVIAGLDPDVPVARVRTMHEVLAAALATPRLTGWLMGVFAGLALAIAAIGLYGVLAYLVGRRTRELGIHVALGAEPSRLRAMVIGQGVRLTLVGIGVGGAGALVAARLMSTLLYGVRPFDLLTFAAVPGLLLVVSLAASYLPARRATQVNPVEALRME